MEKALIRNIKLFYNSAELVYESNDYTSATILYFKCLFLILDYIILKQENRAPKNHSQRFQILKENFPELYDLLDKYYFIYRDTYSLSVSKLKCEEIKENVVRLIKEQKI